MSKWTVEAKASAEAKRIERNRQRRYIADPLSFAFEEGWRAACQFHIWDKGSPLPESLNEFKEWLAKR